MKLKSLEISGFKSFANKTMIELMPGMTGIIGPNGSGKSNIIEAIQWVMGEQSAKDLRGTKMSDVIFGGTDKRGALNRAEVSITFDNSDHYVQSDFNEIRITRKLYRSGESSYLINGVESRLRDIHELFMDTGLGRESFSIISQGRVESIFNAKPEDRRGIIEEVAGVYKYKQNKEKAQKELTQTSDNLSRVADIIHEIESRIDPLAEQAAEATDYLAQKERFDTLDKARLAWSIHDLNGQISSTTKQVETHDKRVNQTKLALDIVNKKLLDKRQERVSAQLSRDSLQAKILECTQKRERLIGAKNLGAQQISTLNRDVESAKKQEFDLQKQHQQLKIGLGQFDTSVQVELQREIQSRIEVNRHHYIQTMQDIATLHNTQKNDEKLLQQLESRQKVLSVRLDNENKELTAIQRTFNKKVPNSDHNDVNITELEKNVADLKKDIGNAAKIYKSTEQNWYKVLDELNKVRSHRDALNSLDEYAGFYQGVRALMKPQTLEKFSGIKGVIAELMTVPSRYALAIETVLGGVLQQVVVDNTSTAKQVISYLTKNRAGRVTILPMDTIKSRHLSGLEAVQHMDGFIGVAADLIDMPEEMSAIKANILGTTVLAENLDQATEIAKRGHFRFRVVSLSGQVVNAGGSMTGGATQKRGATLLSRQSDIAELSERADELTVQARTLEKTLQLKRSTGEQLQEKLLLTQESLRAAQNDTKKIDYELSRQQDAIKQQKRAVQAIQYELKEVSEQQLEMKNRIAKFSTKIKNIEQQKSDQEQLTAKLAHDLETASIKSQSTNEEKATLQTQFATVGAQLDSINGQLSLLQNQRNELQREHSTVEENLKNLQKLLAIAQGNVANQSIIDDMSHQLDATQEKYDNINTQIVALTNSITDLEEQFATQQETLRTLIGSQSQSAAHLARLQTQIENLQTQLLTQYDVGDVEALYQKVADMDFQNITEQLRLVKRSLDEIGNVNIGAIEEYEYVKTRFEFLTKQRDDLNSAKETLLQTIDEMDKEVQVRFKKTFDAVAAHFSDIYAKMFGGGRAEISLTDPAHLLTTGIDITAQPPGKKFQQMRLL
ncbi:chromosome segregation protein SMC, partial [Leuconostoc mesenteroides subsp. mesenteroides]|uniref:chromosome segregation protein SMC n=1 Tax=Leuconostoc mesenteroides TaxID=1245 RepID=UPI0009FE4FEB